MDGWMSKNRTRGRGAGRTRAAPFLSAQTGVRRARGGVRQRGGDAASRGARGRHQPPAGHTFTSQTFEFVSIDTVCVQGGNGTQRRRALRRAPCNAVLWHRARRRLLATGQFYFYFITTLTVNGQRALQRLHSTLKQRWFPTVLFCCTFYTPPREISPGPPPLHTSLLDSLPHGHPWTLRTLPGHSPGHPLDTTWAPPDTT
eukprot:gene12061-biopygen385